jgi:hypothetical protein
MGSGLGHRKREVSAWGHRRRKDTGWGCQGQCCRRMEDSGWGGVEATGKGRTLKGVPGAGPARCGCQGRGDSG